MTKQARARFEVKNWDEKPYQEIEGGAKLTRASVKQECNGDIEGTGAAEYLMCYRPDGSASFVGMQRVEGRVGSHSGSFVLELIGTYDQQAANGTWTVVPGSGTGALHNLTGQGSFVSNKGEHYASVALEYELV